MDPIVTVSAVAGLMWLLTRRKPAKPRKPAEAPARPVDIDPVEPVEPEPPIEPVLVDDKTARLDAINELLRSFISDTPRPGYFYLIRAGDNLSDITREALDSVGPHHNQARLAYMHCLSSSPQWNMELYGTPSTTIPFPKEYLVPHYGIGIRVAFLPRNEDALDLLLQGIMPRMGVDSQSGASRHMGDSYGFLWLPPVDPDSLAAGELDCAPSSWDDGSSTIDPPPQLFKLLEAA